MSNLASPRGIGRIAVEMTATRAGGSLGAARRLAVLVAAIALPAAVLSAEPASRLLGLERLYFERLDDPGAIRPHCAAVLQELLPPALPAPFAPAAGADALCDEMAVRELDLAGAVLRQVLDANHPRIAEQYWGLYTEGRLQELWYFAPLPERTERKQLAPLAAVEVAASGPKEVVPRVGGHMARPQGAWWLDGSDLVFERQPGQLRFRYLVRRFGFNHGYATGGAPPRLSVLAEHTEPAGEALSIGRFVDPPAELLARCGWTTGPGGLPRGNFEELAALARCVTEDPGADRRDRALDSPSFLERGGVPPFPRLAKDHEGDPAEARVSDEAQSRERPPLTPGEFFPPPDSTPLCAGHVAGARGSDGSPGPSISWNAHATDEGVELLVARYTSALGEEPQARGPGCATWRRPPEAPEAALEVCDARREDRPWSRCDQRSSEAAAVVLISTISRAR
jgi:hypothetical protein